jgi:hypothetical protein
MTDSGRRAAERPTRGSCRQKRFQRYLVYEKQNPASFPMSRNSTGDLKNGFAPRGEQKGEKFLLGSAVTH